MKEKPDLVRGWVRKAESDLIAMRASAEAGASDAACFHAQQAAEKYLKGISRIGIVPSRRPITSSS
jgi:HEPN domain-containing protein